MATRTERAALAEIEAIAADLGVGAMFLAEAADDPTAWQIVANKANRLSRLVDTLRTSRALTN